MLNKLPILNSGRVKSESSSLGGAVVVAIEMGKHLRSVSEFLSSLEVDINIRVFAFALVSFG